MTRNTLTQVRAYFEDFDAQLPPFSVDTIVRERPIRETPGAPVPTRPRMPWWRSAPALVAAAMLITVAIGGNMEIDKNRASQSAFLLTGSLERENAASEPIKRLRSVVEVATTKLLAMIRAKG